MKLAMSNIAWSPDERLAAYRVLERAGFVGLEIAPALFFHAAEDPFAPDRASAERALAEIEQSGLALVSMQSLLYGVEGAALFAGCEQRARFEQAMQRAIDLAGRFGIPNCVFGSPVQRRVPDGIAIERAREDAAEVFRRLGDRAAAAGTKLAIEANPERYGTNFLTTLAQAAAFVEQVDHPAIVPILDLGAMHCNAEFDQTPAWINALLPRLNHVHVSEAGLAPAPASETDLRPAFEALRVGGYDKSIAIEMKRDDGGLVAVEEAVSRLRAAANEVGVAHA